VGNPQKQKTKGVGLDLRLCWDPGVRGKKGGGIKECKAFVLGTPCAKKKEEDLLLWAGGKKMTWVFRGDGKKRKKPGSSNAGTATRGKKEINPFTFREQGGGKKKGGEKGGGGKAKERISPPNLPPKKMKKSRRGPVDFPWRSKIRLGKGREKKKKGHYIARNNTGNAPGSKKGWGAGKNDMTLWRGGGEEHFPPKG